MCCREINISLCLKWNQHLWVYVFSWNQHFAVSEVKSTSLSLCILVKSTFCQFWSEINIFAVASWHEMNILLFIKWGKKNKKLILIWITQERIALYLVQIWQRCRPRTSDTAIYAFRNISGPLSELIYQEFAIFSHFLK